MEYLKQMGVNLNVRTIRRKLIFRQACLILASR